MQLFPVETDPARNLLPKDGIVNYYGKLWTQTEADLLLHDLLNTIEWRNDEAVIYGKRIVTKRKVAWYGERDFEYTYSNTTKRALPWTKILLDLKNTLEKTTGET